MLIVFSAVGVAFCSGCGNTAEPSKPPYVSVISDCCGDIKAKKQVLNHRSVYYGGGIHTLGWERQLLSVFNGHTGDINSDAVK